MLIGYYLSNGKYGLDFRHVKNYAPILRTTVREYMTSETSEEQGFALFKEGLREANPKWIVLGLDWRGWAEKHTFPGDIAFEAIEIVRSLGMWNRVLTVEIDDEPGWDTETATAIFELYKAALRNTKSQPPQYGAGIVEHGRGILDTNGWRVFDWVGLEGYVDPPGDWDPKRNRQRLNATMREQYAKLDRKPFLWVMQGYDRNGAWKNEYTLAALQADSFSLMRSKPFKDTILPFSLIFAHSRPGGTKDNPVLGEVHRAYVYGTRTRMDVQGEDET